MKILRFKSDVEGACQNVPIEVLLAIRTLVEFADTQKTKVVTDHGDNFLSIGNNSDEGLELSLCLRSY